MVKELIKKENLWKNIEVEDLEDRKEFSVLPIAQLNDCDTFGAGCDDYTLVCHEHGCSMWWGPTATYGCVDFDPVRPTLVPC